MKKKTIITKHSEAELPDTPKMGAGFFAAGIRVNTPEELWEATGAGVPKQQITLRVDEDVIAFFKEQGKGYQRLMNFALRAYMLRRKSTQSVKADGRRKRQSA
jgi:uncharacterized protein (DUF4415 family)